MSLKSLFLKPPVFDDEEKTLAAQQLFAIIRTVMALSWLALIIAIIVPETLYRWLSVIAFIVTSGLALLALNARGHTRLAANLLIGAFWLAATGMALTGGGIESNAISIYLIIILIAGMLQSGRAGMLIAVFCSLTGLMLVYMENIGVLPASRVHHTHLTIWIAYTIYMIIVIVLQYLVSSTIKNALKKSRQEIKERRKAEEELREGQRTLATLIGNLPGFVYRCGNDRDWTMKYISEGCREVTGYEPDEFIGSKTLAFNDIVHPDFREPLWEKWQEVLKTKNPFEAEYPIISRGGKIRWVWERGVGICAPEGNLLFLEGFITDITMRKLSDEALQRSMEKLRKAVGNTIEVITMAVETRDPYTAGHQKRVADLARSIAAAMNLPTDQIDGIRIAATIHDLGKISIPAEILSMPRKLTDIEYRLVRNHSRAGYDILKDVDFGWPIADIVLQHHERIDGSGYPQGLMGNEILLEARIIAVADVVEAIATHRPYRPALGIETALEEIENNKGIRYDPGVVDVCLKIFRDEEYTFLRG